MEVKVNIWVSENPEYEGYLEASAKCVIKFDSWIKSTVLMDCICEKTVQDVKNKVRYSLERTGLSEVLSFHGKEWDYLQKVCDSAFIHKPRRSTFENKYRFMVNA